MGQEDYAKILATTKTNNISDNTSKDSIEEHFKGSTEEEKHVCLKFFYEEDDYYVTRAIM